jgi:hypothetical protein
MGKILSGGCYCGAVQFTVEDNFSRFFFCHCEQCRKRSGTAHVANLFTTADSIHWVKGVDQIKRYDDLTSPRSITKSFCKECGSPVPYTSKDGVKLVVPAGSLNEEPTKQVDAKIFCGEQTHWYKVGIQAPAFDGSPDKK